MMVVSTMTEVPHGKARANSTDATGYNNNSDDSHHDDNNQLLDYNNDYALRQRATSSEAQLPSQSHSHDNHLNNSDHGSSISITSSSCDGSNDSSTRSPTRPTLQRHNSYNTKRLQTIESGIALADSANNSPHGTPKPPLHPSNNNNGTLLHSPDTLSSADKVVIDKPDAISQRNSSHQSQHSSISHYSYYSVDAGKHGFLSQGDDSDSVNYNGCDYDAGSANGSLVFKYLPGEETPPAEYALPASILKVYGVDCDGYTQHNHDHENGSAYDVEEGKTMENTNNGMPWNPTRSDRADGSYSSILFTEEEDEESGSSPNGIMDGASSNNNKRTTKQQQQQPRVSPRSNTRNNSTSLRIPHLLASAPSSSAESSSRSSPKLANRILPYHERKRLMELEEEENKRRTTTSKNNGQGGGRNGKKNSKVDNNKKNSKNVSKNRNKNGEKAPLTGKQRGGYGSTTLTNTNSDDNNNKEQQPPTTEGWFNQLLSTVTGKPPSTTPAGEEERNYEQTIQDETKSYRDRGRAFLAETERERKMMKEQMKMGELNSVMVPVAKKSFGHKVKMSSMSAALDSIADCGDSQEDETSCSSSDDEESGSYLMKEQQQQQQRCNNNKVWKYGDTPTTCNSTTTNNAPKKKKISRSSSSTRDRIMKRERLLQEEYEYRLHSLKRENEKLSKKFRIFVLVAVACVFTGALAFAFVVCVRILVSI